MGDAQVQWQVIGSFAGFFDTRVGAKREAASYRAIAEQIGHPPSAIVFLSDVLAELDAARAAGLHTVHLVRDDQPTGDHPVAATFDDIAPQEIR